MVVREGGEVEAKETGMCSGVEKQVVQHLLAVSREIV